MTTTFIMFGDNAPHDKLAPLAHENFPFLAVIWLTVCINTRKALNMIHALKASYNIQYKDYHRIDRTHTNRRL